MDQVTTPMVCYFCGRYDAHGCDDISPCVAVFREDYARGEPKYVAHGIDVCDDCKAKGLKRA